MNIGYYITITMKNHCFNYFYKSRFQVVFTLLFLRTDNMHEGVSRTMPNTFFTKMEAVDYFRNSATS